MKEARSRALGRLTCTLCFTSVAAKIIWSTTPSTADIIQTSYPLGNGRLGALAYGVPGAEILSLNVDSLWSGGPFQVSNYTGGNPTSPVNGALPGIRSFIFENGTGEMDALLGSDDFYGSYQVLANLSVTVPSLQDVQASNYTRQLDLETGLHTTSFSIDIGDFKTETFCSFPDQVCVYSISSTTQLPKILASIGNTLVDPSLQNVSCSAGLMTLDGLTQAGPPEGMHYTAQIGVLGASVSQCSPGGGTLNITPMNGTQTVTVVVAAGTNYDAKMGNAESGYSFRGDLPGAQVAATIASVVAQDVHSLRTRHLTDFKNLTGQFTLSLPDTLGSANTETATLISQYNSSDVGGDPFLESLLFDYGRYLFISSSRPGSLPPNLQGRWCETLGAAWSGDYHANINLQMNHWLADQTGLSDLQSPLWDYMTDTWVPRGSETAMLWYGAPGFVVHDESTLR